MIRIPVLDIDSLQLWQDIVKNKHIEVRDRLLACENTIKIRYELYQNNLQTLENILSYTSFSETEKNDLKDCYRIKNITFSAVRKKIFENHDKSMQGLCPYCMRGEADSLDHYLGKGLYPELSVFIPNLVPCCSRCNREKGENFLDGGERQYLYFYQDEIPTYQFLFIRFSFARLDSTPDIKIRLDFGDDNRKIVQIIRNHFDSLKLVEKYKKSINDKLSVILEGVKILSKEGCDLSIAVKMLQSQHASLSNRYGTNYWESCIFEGVLNSPSFLQSFFVA